MNFLEAIKALDQGEMITHNGLGDGHFLLVDGQIQYRYCESSIPTSAFFTQRELQAKWRVYIYSPPKISGTSALKALLKGKVVKDSSGQKYAMSRGYGSKGAIYYKSLGDAGVWMRLGCNSGASSSFVSELENNNWTVTNESHSL